MCVCVCVYIYIYIYIKREREEHECAYIYIYPERESRMYVSNYLKKKNREKKVDVGKLNYLQCNECRRYRHFKTLPE